MDLTEETSADVTIVAVAGRLDTQTASRCSDRLAELLRSGHGRLLIDVSRLDYISSAGLRALLVAAKQAAQIGGKLAVCCMSAQVKDVIEIAGLDAVLDLYSSRDEALAQLSAG